MTERERLIELLKNDNCPSPFVCDANCKYINSDNCSAERIADYLLENGVIVPPVKIGDTVYLLSRGDIIPINIIAIQGNNSGNFLIGMNEENFGYSTISLHLENNWGAEWYITREEAEKARAERSNT